MPSLPNPRRESRESSKARNKTRVEDCTRAIVDRFERGDLPDVLAPIFINRDDADVPCRKWSWRNQLLTALSGHDDARIGENSSSLESLHV